MYPMAIGIIVSYMPVTFFGLECCSIFILLMICPDDIFVIESRILKSLIVAVYFSSYFCHYLLWYFKVGCAYTY